MTANGKRLLIIILRDLSFFSFRIFIETSIGAVNIGSLIRNEDEITSPTMHHTFRPSLSDFKVQKS